MSELSDRAKNIARNSGFYVFPCREDNKRPCWPGEEGVKRGFHDATTDPVEIDRLFLHPGAGLIGIRAGETSGVSILDVDVKHESARAWWIKNQARLPATRTHRTRGGGLHLLFQHAPGVRNSEGKPVVGIDTRGEGGYFIHWFAAGLECLDHAPPAPWPQWLTTFFWPPPPPKSVISNARADAKMSDVHLERIKQRALDGVRDAGEGQRHNRIRSSARLLGGIQARADFTDAQAIEWITSAAGVAGEKKAENTILWGLERGRSEPLDLGARR